MGVVISQKPSSWRKRPTVRLALVLLFGAAGLMLFSIVAYREPPSEDWTVAQLIQAVREQNVSRLHVSGDRVIVETATGVRGLVHKTREVSIAQLLRDQGVPEERLGRLTIVNVAPSGPLQWVLKWLWSVPIVILILGLGGILIKRAQLGEQHN